MDSHQSELAVEMAEHGWASVASPRSVCSHEAKNANTTAMQTLTVASVYMHCRTLASTIQRLSQAPTSAGASSAFPAYEPTKIQSILDEQLGWT